MREQGKIPNTSKNHRFIGQLRLTLHLQEQAFLELQNIAMEIEERYWKLKEVKDGLRKNRQECAEIHSMVAAHVLLPHARRKVIVEALINYGKKLTAVVNPRTQGGRGLNQVLKGLSNIEKSKRKIEWLMWDMGNKLELMQDSRSGIRGNWHTPLKNIALTK